MLPQGGVRDLWITNGVVAPGPVPGAVTLASDCWIMPGLVDAHCHIGLDSHGGTTMDTARAQARTDRDAGTLLIRDAGSPIDTHELDHEADMPRIIRAGRHIARPKRYLRHYGVEIETGQLVDEVTRQARRGDGWVKLVGDWIDRDLGDLAPLWDPDEASMAIAAAHAQGARVTAHCFGEQSVAELVGAGIDCIEHGTGMSDEVIAAMAARGVALVPTMINLATFPDIARAAEAKYPRYASHMRALFEGHLPMLRAAREAGVAIYAGTDAGGRSTTAGSATRSSRWRSSAITSSPWALRAGGRANGWGPRDWRWATAPTWWSMAPIPAKNSRSCAVRNWWSCAGCRSSNPRCAEFHSRAAYLAQ